MLLNKILGKKDKGLDVYSIPDKKYCHDTKKLHKMEKKDLLEQIQTMEKYISLLCSKLEEARKQHEKTVDKLEETSEKMNVVNSKMSMISNQHQQLQVKFTNLQNSLQIMAKEKQLQFKFQLQFLQSKQLNRQKIADLAGVLKVYRDQMNLVQKIVHQNKQLKQKYTQLQSDYFNLSDKIAQSKNKSGEQQTQTKASSKSGQDTEPDDEKNGQLKLILQTKQQMIILLNKKLGELQDKFTETQQKNSDLNHQIQKHETQIKQKIQQIKRWQSQVNQHKKRLASMKQVHEKHEKAYNVSKQQNKKLACQIEKLNNQLIQISHRLKLNEEEKKILIGNSNQNIMNSQQTEKQFQLQYEKCKHQIQVKQRQIQKLNKKLTQSEQQIKHFQNIINQHKMKEKQFQKIIQQLAQQTNKNAELNKHIQNLEQNYQIKLKKIQFNFNQERIKADGLKRSLTNTETKEQEHRKKLDQMYEKKVIQDNKYAKMETKLKQYKQLCQYLQKQKIQLEKTFQNKIRNMQEIVINQNEEQQIQKTQNSEPIQNNSDLQDDSVLINKLQSKIVDLEQQIQFLKQQNGLLMHKKDELEESNLELSKNYKVLNQKREEVMKQINRMASVDNNFQVQKNKIDQKMGVGVRSREKKIAEKSLKALDILSKMLASLYKQFINVHVANINQKQIKDLEGQINALVGKCEDMKDIFQGYL